MDVIPIFVGTQFLGTKRVAVTIRTSGRVMNEFRSVALLCWHCEHVRSISHLAVRVLIQSSKSTSSYSGPISSSVELFVCL